MSVFDICSCILQIYDAETFQKIQKLERSDLASHYATNIATFSPDDELVLSDGLLWDVRASNSRPIHKFDKFNANISGVFHPQGLEVIINTEVVSFIFYFMPAGEIAQKSALV